MISFQMLLEVGITLPLEQPTESKRPLPIFVAQTSPNEIQRTKLPPAGNNGCAPLGARRVAVSGFPRS